MRLFLLSCGAACIFGCHLIGGAGDLEFFADVTGGGPGSGGAGGDSCLATCTDPCWGCDVEGSEGTCALEPSGTSCEGGLCDAEGVCSTGTPLWSRLYGNSEDSRANDGAVLSDDDVVVAGYYVGGDDFSLDGHPFSDADSANAGDFFVARMGTSGQTKWVVDGGSNADLQSITAVAVDSDDNVLVAGQYLGTITLDPWDPLPAATTEDLFVGKLGGTTGSPVWSFAASGDDIQEIRDIAVSSADRTAVGGVTYGNVTLPSASFNHSGTGPNGFVLLFEKDAVMDPGTGEIRWALLFDGPEDEVNGVAFDHDGALWAVGTYPLALTVEGTPVPQPTAPSVIAVKLSQNTLDVQDIYTFLAASGSSAAAKAVAATDDGVVLAGVFDGHLDLGPIGLDSDGDADLWVAEIALDGTPRWAKAFAIEASSSLDVDIAVDDAGNIAVTGTAAGTAQLGSFELESAGQQLFVAKLGPTGEVLWAKGAPDADGGGTGVAFTSEGRLLLTGFASTPVFGTMDRPAGGEDISVTLLGQ